MITALSNLSPEWFTPSGQEESDEVTRFKIKPLNGLEYMSIVGESSFREDGSIAVSANAANLILKAGLVDWENFNNANGKKVKFSIHNFKLIPVLVITEIINRIIEISSLTGEQIKN